MLCNNNPYFDVEFEGYDYFHHKTAGKIAGYWIGILHLISHHVVRGYFLVSTIGIVNLVDVEAATSQFVFMTGFTKLPLSPCLILIRVCVAYRNMTDQPSHIVVSSYGRGRANTNTKLSKGNQEVTSLFLAGFLHYCTFANYLEQTPILVEEILSKVWLC